MTIASAHVALWRDGLGHYVEAHVSGIYSTPKRYMEHHPTNRNAMKACSDVRILYHATKPSVTIIFILKAK